MNIDMIELGMPSSHLTQRARDLRAERTRCEALLWSRLRDRRMAGWKWKRQVPRGPYIVDFLCAEAGLVVELDGGQHTSQVEYDQRRTDYLERAGLKVIRFWNSAVLKNLAGVCDAIHAACGGDAPGYDPQRQSLAPRDLGVSRGNMGERRRPRSGRR